ncbi:MAG TPA: glycosyltransferase family 1 protein [Polyangiaceae bacterium]|jgi:glycosyltransferase involved in cell wall biosynthesis
MHLGINAIRLCRNFTGVGRYIECVLAEWAKIQLPFERVTLFTHTPLEQSKITFPLDRFEQRVIGRTLPDPIWEATALRQAAAQVDLLFGPSYTLPLGFRGKCVVTNHGPAQNERFSYQWLRANAYEVLYRASAHRAARVLAASQSVRTRLIDVYGVPSEKITVTYLAASSMFRPIDDRAVRRQVCEKYRIVDAPFILFVGKMARRHYIPHLVEAFARLKADPRVSLRLVLIGPDYLNLDIPRLARSHGVGEHVTHVPYATHADLPALYSAAEFFVFPASEAEGFGVPVLEAMACGTPVIATALGSLKEFAPGAALTTPSPSTDDLYAAMQRLAFDEPLRRELVHSGFARAAEFGWPITAKKTMDVLWDVASQP